MSTLFDIDDVPEIEERPGIPPRSKLYCLEPMGLDSGMVESLTSYTARLAAAHSITLAALGWASHSSTGNSCCRQRYQGNL